MIDAATYGLATDASPQQNKLALLQAVSAAPGETVLIAEGIYAIDPVTITEPHTTLLFAPGAVMQVAPESKTPAILCIAADNVHIEGGQFDGSGIAGNAGVMAIRVYGSCSHIVIRNCTIRNASTGIGSYNAANCGDWLIENNHIDTIVRSHGIYLHGQKKDNAGITGVRVLNNTITGTKHNGIWVGIRFADVLVAGNQVANSERMGIEVWNNPEGRFVIANNIVDDCAHFGISIAMTSHTSCHGNLVKNVTGYGIEVANSCFVALVGNHIDGVKDKEGGGKATGIVLNAQVDYRVSNISISGGSISHCTSAINVSGAAARRDNIAISGVIIRDCTVGVRNVGNIGAVDGGGQVSHLAITGCAIHVAKVGIGNSVYGGLLRGGIIAGNNIHVTEGDGIDLFRAAEMAIVGNRIVGADVPGSVGIRLRDHDKGELKSHDLLVTGNHILHFETTHLYNPRIAQEMEVV